MQDLVSGFRNVEPEDAGLQNSPERYGRIEKHMEICGGMEEVSRAARRSRRILLCRILFLQYTGTVIKSPLESGKYSVAYLYHQQRKLTCWKGELL